MITTVATDTTNLALRLEFLHLPIYAILGNS